MRKYLTHILIISFVFISMPAIRASAEEEKDRLLVVPLKAQLGLKYEEAVMLSDVLSIELHKSGKFIILNRDDMKAVLDEKEFELAMGCDDNVCLLENVEKLAVNKIITGNIGKLGRKYIVSIRMINEDGENEVMEKDVCDCPIEGLIKSMERVSYKFLSYLTGEEKPLLSRPNGMAGRAQGIQPDRKIINLRSSHRELSVSQVQSMPNISIRSKEDWGFYGHSTINHNYNLRSISGDKVVLDHATGLMWHQNGSDKYMKWNDAKEWVRSLNSGGYAGYNDWRLPTLEEAASLLESSDKNGDLYIDPIFSNKQRWIWTGDRRTGSEAAWSVHFYVGCVLWRYLSSYIYVRPVRSGTP